MSRIPRTLGAPAPNAPAAALDRALRGLVVRVRATLPRVRSEADARALGAVLRREYSDAKLAAIVRDVGVSAERAASRPWAALVRAAGRGDAARDPDDDVVLEALRAIQRESDEQIAAGRRTHPITPTSRNVAFKAGWKTKRGPADAKRARAALVRLKNAGVLQETTSRHFVFAATASLVPYDGRKLIDAWSRDATKLIRSVRDEVAPALRADIVHALEHGVSAEDLAQRWISRGVPVEFGTLEGRMRTIARHQLSVLHARVQSERARAVGVREFVWRTQGDDRVRDEHERLEGTRHAYDEPPDEGLPGEPVNCRCWAESVIPDDLAEALGLEFVIGG